MVDTFGNNIVSAFTGGVPVKAIYAYGEKVWPVASYYIRWTPSDLSTGTFSIDGTTYNFSDYSGYFTDFNGVITSDAFKDTGIETLETNAIKINNGMYGAFGNCTSLRSINLISCSYIGRWTFSSCYSLSEISVPVCKSMGYAAFYRCSSLSHVSLPMCENLEDSYGQFQQCVNLVYAYLPKCTYLNPDTFNGCINFESLYLPGSEFCSLGYSDAFNNTKITTSTGSIYVPASMVNTYKLAKYWSYFSNIIYPIQ